MSEFNKEFCPVCGKPLPLYKQMYCSRACREEAYRERWKKPKKEAVKKKKGLSWDEAFSFQCGWNDALKSVAKFAPTVDAVEVVRCKDCYYCATEKSFDKEYLYCDAFAEHAEGDLIGVSLMVEPNHFCSWGERREDETD